MVRIHLSETKPQTLKHKPLLKPVRKQNPQLLLNAKNPQELNRKSKPQQPKLLDLDRQISSECPGPHTSRVGIV